MSPLEWVQGKLVATAGAPPSPALEGYRDCLKMALKELWDIEAVVVPEHVEFIGGEGPG